MSKQNKTDRDTKNGYKMATIVYPKSDERYWQSRVFHHKRADSKGEEVADKTYSIRISHSGRRQYFQLHTANKKQAGRKAKDIYLLLKAKGWDEALSEHKPKTVEVIKGATIGELIRVYTEHSAVPAKTKANYARALRSVVAGIKNISGDKKRFDYVNGGADKWRAKVDAVKLSDITMVKLNKWIGAYVESRGTDPVKKISATRTVNSYIRYCRSLFSIKVIAYLKTELELPDVSPFHEVDLLKSKGKGMKYNSTFSIENLSMKARDELPGIEQDQQWLIFMLAVSAGMRRNEIDKLMWKQIIFSKNIINLEATKYFSPKSEGSGTEVSIDPELTEMLRGYKARIKGEFVIKEKVAPRMKSKVAHYRANRHFIELIKWLKKNGVDDRKPLHALRKEAGSLVNQEHGLVAASQFLRHADIQVTAAHYIDTPKEITSGLGPLLSGKVESITKEKEERHA